MQAGTAANAGAAAAAAPAAAAHAAAGTGPSGQHQQQTSAQKQKRLYFIDWLRTVLTVLVVVHHVWNSFRTTGGDIYWVGQKSDKPDYLVETIITWVASTPSMPYAMCLFFLLAGYLTPGSYNRKGPLLHAYDRLIRLLLPVVVYAVLIHPLILTINKAAGVPAAVAAKILPVAGFMQSASYSEAWRWWFANFNIVPGPTWFIWCLFWFDIGYVLLRMLHKAAVGQGWLPRQSESVSAAAAPKGSSNGAARTATAKQTSSGDAVVDVANGSSSRVSDKTAAVQLAAAEEYSVKAVLIGMAVLTLAFTAVSFGAVMATYNSDKAMGYDGFYVVSPLIVFRPSWIGPNAISYILGCQGTTSNLLRKLPACMTFYCLGAAALWWPIGCGIPDYLALPYRPEELWGTYPISSAMVGYVLYSKFSQWAFAVVWAVGLLLLFREQFNHAPGKLGKQLIAGAYGAYIIHPLFIPLWAWAFRGVPFTTLVGNAIAVSPLVVVSSWAFTAVVRCVPGT